MHKIFNAFRLESKLKTTDQRCKGRFTLHWQWGEICADSHNMKNGSLEWVLCNSSYVMLHVTQPLLLERKALEQSLARRERSASSTCNQSSKSEFWYIASSVSAATLHQLVSHRAFTQSTVLSVVLKQLKARLAEPIGLLHCVLALFRLLWYYRGTM